MHLMGLMTGVVNVVVYNSDLELKLAKTVEEGMNDCQERGGLGTMDRGVRKDLQD